MTERRGGVILWIGYAIAFLICDFFYTLIFGRFPLLGSVPNFLPVALPWRRSWRAAWPGRSSVCAPGCLPALRRAGPEPV